ncbi:hypothetical protein ACFY2M_42090 [Streptomyces sp. NPDC001276]|uniref:hypothetical protein n=1 Tax=Streptomyces sp. NPDC001276 TaxID=3364555 RepID=UPI003685AC13
MALAARPLPGVADTPADARIRPSWREFTGPGPRPAEPRRHLFAGLSSPLIVVFVVGVADAQNKDTSPDQARFWFFLLAAAGALTATALALDRNRPGLPGAGQIALSAMMSAVVFVRGLVTGEGLDAYAPDAFSGGYALLILLVGMFIWRGLGLLLRHASLRGVLPWLLPARLPFVPGLLPSIGLWQTILYLNEFHVDVEDVQIPAWDQFQFTPAPLAILSLWLIAPALLEWAQHLHFMVRERWIVYAGLVLVSAWFLLIGAWNFAYVPAVEAGFEVYSAVSEGREAPGGYRVSPESVCVRPLNNAAAVPVDGGVLDPDRPYLKVGDADGTAVLATTAEQPLKVRLSAVPLVPALFPPGARTCSAILGSH